MIKVLADLVSSEVSSWLAEGCLLIVLAGSFLCARVPLVSPGGPNLFL